MMSPEIAERLPSSQKRIEANRRNAKRSTGPRTPAGKSTARRNALKHGLTSEKLVVLGEDAEEFQCMADGHRAAFRPQNAVELALANTFSLAEWRRQRCASTEAAMTDQYIRDRALNEQEGREDDVLNVGGRLFHDKQNRWRLYPDPIADTESTFTREQRPGDLDAPERLLRDLESNYAGCRWLLDRWRELKTHYHSEGGWRPYDMFKLIRLTGKQPIDIAEDPSGDLLAIFLACHKLDEADESPFCKLKCELDDDQYPDIEQRLRESGLEARGPTSREQARAILDELFERHTSRLARLARKHKAEDRAEARERQRRLAFDPGQEADKVRRYEDIAVRRMTRVCEELIKLRRADILDEAVDDTPSPSPQRGEGARRAGEGFSLESRRQAVPGPAKAGTPTAGVGAGTSPSPQRGEGVRMAGEGYSLESRLQAVPGPAKAGTPTGGVGDTSPSTLRGEGARRAGEGACPEPEQVRLTDEPNRPGAPQESPTYETNVRLESLIYESDVALICPIADQQAEAATLRSPVVGQPSNPTARACRSVIDDRPVVFNRLLLAIAFCWLVAGGGGQWARLSGSATSRSFRAQADGSPPRSTPSKTIAPETGPTRQRGLNQLDTTQHRNPSLARSGIAVNLAQQGRLSGNANCLWCRRAGCLACNGIPARRGPHICTDASAVAISHEPSAKPRGSRIGESGDPVECAAKRTHRPPGRPLCGEPRTRLARETKNRSHKTNPPKLLALMQSPLCSRWRQYPTGSATAKATRKVALPNNAQPTTNKPTTEH
jgi:hypothetical protein